MRNPSARRGPRGGRSSHQPTAARERVSIAPSTQIRTPRPRVTRSEKRGVLGALSGSHEGSQGSQQVLVLRWEGRGETLACSPSPRLEQAPRGLRAPRPGLSPSAASTSLHGD